MTSLTVLPENKFSLNPKSLEEAIKFSEIMANSSMVPKIYQGKPADILVAVQMGSEVGLKPIQALQNIAVINGKPAVYGDALLALVQANPTFEDIKEYFDEKLQAAVCMLKRINQSQHTVIYSIEDAKKAGLWNKSGPWQQYPKRMLQMRARGFALRDKFADVLGGLISAEEARDYPVDINPIDNNKKTETINTINIENDDIVDIPFDVCILSKIREIDLKYIDIFMNITDPSQIRIHYDAMKEELHPYISDINAKKVFAELKNISLRRHKQLSIELDKEIIEMDNTNG